MKVMILHSMASVSVCSRISAFNAITKSSVSYAIGDLVEKSTCDSDCISKDDEIRYGPELEQLVEDIMNSFTKLDHYDWFKEIYLVPESNGMILVIQ